MMTPTTQGESRQEPTQQPQHGPRMMPRTEPRRQRGRPPSEQFQYSQFMSAASYQQQQYRSSEEQDAFNRLLDRLNRSNQDPTRLTPRVPTELRSPTGFSWGESSAQSQDQIMQSARSPRSFDNQVYNDSFPPLSQPQTPANLPESRHRSRWHSSFTMPTRRPGTPSRWARPSLDAGMAPPRVDREGYELRPRHRGSGSPVGMRSRGFVGLFGGRENGDDEEMLGRGLRELSSTRRQRSPDGTPEREERR